MILHDSHAHTRYSPDSEQEPSGLFSRAAEIGLRALTVTDHADVIFLDRADMKARIAASVQAVEAARGRYGALHLLTGVELAEWWHDPSFSEELLGAAAYDLVIGSVHTVRTPEISMPYSHVDFRALSESARRYFLSLYFDQLLRLAEEGHYDTLAHLTCPLRYMVGKYGLRVELSEYDGVIRRILSAVIRRGKALEINSSNLAADPTGGLLMPDAELLRLYRSLGGRRITFGADAHVAANVAAGFGAAEAAAREAGFDSYVYFRRRKPITVSFDGTERENDMQ